MRDANTELIKSIESDGLGILSDYSEIALDATLESGVLKDIPVFGSLFKLSKIGISIKDQIFINKLKGFLLSVNKVDSEKRRGFIHKYLRDDKKKAELGEKLIHTIDNIDSSQKALLVGKAFNLYIEEKINKIEFYDLAYTIELFKLHYAEVFIEMSLTIEDKKTKDEIADHFFTCGLLFSDTPTWTSLSDNSETNYTNDRITNLGRLFLEKILEYDKDELKKKYIEKIINIEYYENTEMMDWVFIKTVDRKELIKMLETESFNSILNYCIRSPYVSKIKGKDYNVIIKTNDGNYALYKIPKE